MGNYTTELEQRMNQNRYGQMVLEAEAERVLNALEQWSNDNFIHIHGEAELEAKDNNINLIKLKFDVLNKTEQDLTELSKNLSNKFNSESQNHLVLVKFIHEKI